MSDCAQLFLSLGDEWLVVGSHLATLKKQLVQSFRLPFRTGRLLNL